MEEYVRRLEGENSRLRQEIARLQGIESELRQTEVALRASEERARRQLLELEQIYRFAPIGLFIFDREGRFLRINEQMADINGFPVEDHIGRSLQDVVPDLAESLMEICRPVFERGEPVLNMEIHGVTPKLPGVERDWLASYIPLKGGDGRTIALIGAVLEITQRKQAEQALRAIFAASPMAIFTIDPDGIVKTWNPAAERIFGWSAEEVIGHLLPLVPEESRDEFRALREKVLRGESFTGYETRRVRRDGTYLDVSINAAPTRDAAGNVTGVMSLLEDITERKQLREQYLHAQKMESVGRLAGGIAHDFNNLLTAILGYSELCALNLSPADPITGYIEQIRKAGDRATGLTRQLLAFARRQIFDPRIINLNDLTLDMDKLLRRVLGEDIELVTALTPDLWPVKADPGQVEQVLLNLAVNARDAMPDGGRLTIETSNIILDANYARNHADVAPGPYVMVAVTDTGIGMSREIQEHMFEPFFTTKSYGKGTGLGLATCHGIVKQSGGHIWVYSEPGKGTTFKVYLPREEGMPETISRMIGPQVQGGTETILLLEDDPLVREVAAQVLTERGYTVLAGGSGDEALIIANGYSGEIHLLLTDVILPQMGGRQVAERLQEQYPDLKVLYMSGYAENSVVHHGMLDPGIAFLAKPFTPAALAHKVREVLDSRR